MIELSDAKHSNDYLIRTVAMVTLNDIVLKPTLRLSLIVAAFTLGLVAVVSPLSVKCPLYYVILLLNYVIMSFCR